MRARLARIVLISIAAALVTATVHLSITTISRELLGVFSWMWWSRDQLWITPLAYVLLFVPIGVLVAVPHAVWPRMVRLSWVAAGFAGLSALSVLLLEQRIAPWAWVIVAVGVTIQAHRFLPRNEVRVGQLARGTAVVLGALWTVIGGSGLLLAARAERSAMAALTEPPSGSPNVLLLILDTVRASEMSLYGLDQPTTPRLDLRAKGGAVFDRAYSTAPWTLPSHASMFTGRVASQTSADWGVPLNDDLPTLAEVFRDRGFATGGFVANLHMTGYRTGLARGFVRYEDAKRTLPEVLYNTTLAQTMWVERAVQVWRRTHWLGGVVRSLAWIDLMPNGKYNSHAPKNAQEVTSDFLQWQSQLGDRPFFAFVNIFDAHIPYVSPSPYDTLFRNVTVNQGRYRGSIRYIDDALDSLFNVLEQRGVLKSTIVIVTSDHGEQFGEHNLKGHGNSLFLPLLHVPLVILAPGRVNAATRVGTPVSLRDLAATVLDLAGRAPNEGGIQGVSLAPLARGDASVRPSHIIAEVNRGINDSPRNPTKFGDLKAAFDDTLQVFADSRGRLEAYNLLHDPNQQENLARDAFRRASASTWLDAKLDSAAARWPTRPSGRVRILTVSP